MIHHQQIIILPYRVELVHTFCLLESICEVSVTQTTQRQLVG